MSISVSDLAYAPPGGDQLFFDVTFGVAPGDRAALVGANGVGKSTILRILSGEIESDDGDHSIVGTMLSMTQDVGMSRPTDSLRDMLIEVAPPHCERRDVVWLPPSVVSRTIRPMGRWSTPMLWRLG